LRNLKDRDGQFKELADYIARKVLGANSIKIDLQNDSVFISIDDGKPRPIENLGDGIMHLLVMILAIYDAHHKVVFIDEPEHGLHPGYIRIFFKAINEIKRESAKQLFIVTHSTQYSK
jgi:AAA15 family ATPase/GTPase